MSSTVPPAAETEEAFEPDTWEIPEAMPDATAPAQAGRGLPGPPPHVPPPGLPLQRPRLSPAVPPSGTGAASVKQPDSAQRAVEPQPSSKVVQPPPLPRQRRPGTNPSTEAPGTSGTPSEARPAAAGMAKEWSLLDPGGASKTPSVERVVVKPERAPAAPASTVRRPSPLGSAVGAKSPVQTGTARPVASNTERPQGTAVPPPARHGSADPAVPVARPVAQSPTLIMPALRVEPPASARQQPEDAWDLEEPAPTTVVAVPPSKPQPASREGAPSRAEPASPAREARAAPAAKVAPAPASPESAKLREASPGAVPAEPTKSVDRPAPATRDAKPDAPLPAPAAREVKPDAPLPAPAARDAKPDAPPPAPAAPTRVVEAKGTAEPRKTPIEPQKATVEAPRVAAPMLEAKTVEPPAFEPKISQPPPEDVGWLGPIIESGASLDEIERREASVLLDFDSDLLPSAAEREQQAPGQSSGESVCTFWLGQDCFGLDVQLVSEVLLIDDILPVPWAPAALLGLFNSRGRIVPVVDLAALLGLEPAAAGSSGGAHAAPAILIKADSLVAAAIIDRPGLVVQINRGAVTPTERGSAEPWVKGHLRLDERSHSAVTLLDPESLVQRFLDMSRFPDIRTCLGGAGHRPARATSAKNSEGDIS